MLNKTKDSHTTVCKQTIDKFKLKIYFQRLKFKMCFHRHKLRVTKQNQVTLDIFTHNTHFLDINNVWIQLSYIIFYTTADINVNQLLCLAKKWFEGLLINTFAKLFNGISVLVFSSYIWF